MWLGANGPSTVGTESRRLLTARSRAAIEQGRDCRLRTGVWLCIRPRDRRRSGSAAASAGASAAATAAPGGRANPGPRRSPRQVSAARSRRPRTRTGWRRRGRGGQVDTGDFQTVQRSTNRSRRRSRRRTTSSSSSSAPPAELRRHQEKADKQEPLPPFALKTSRSPINVDADYTIVQTRLTRNVVGIVQGTDPKLRDSYVLFGAHYDHVGYSADRRRGTRGGGGGGAGGAGRMRGAGARHAEARRRHQQRRGRRRVGDGGDHGDREGVRDRTEAEALAAVRVARRRGVGAARLALHGGLSRRAARQGRGGAEHRHGRPQPLRRSERVEHGVPGRAPIASAPSCTTSTRTRTARSRSR